VEHTWNHPSPVAQPNPADVGHSRNSHGNPRIAVAVPLLISAFHHLIPVQNCLVHPKLDRDQVLCLFQVASEFCSCRDVWLWPRGVLGLSMPVMNGFDAARILKRQMPTVPLIMYSAFGDKLAENQARLIGISEVVSKSEHASVLIHRARDLLYSAAA
jgi:DNA-binding NarL/FixJ family response regulator